MGFPLVIAVVIILGTSLVLYARSTNASAVSPKLNVGAAGQGGGDRRHCGDRRNRSGYGLWRRFVGGSATGDWGGCWIGRAQR